METVQEKIERFSEYNKRMIDVALSKPNLAYQGLGGKLILCAIFDSLSLVAIPELAEKNRERFLQTIALHSSWPDSDRVSLLHLWHAFDCCNSIPQDFLMLHKWVSTKKEKFFPQSRSLLSASYDLSIDPKMEELITRWPHEAGKPKKLNGKLNPHQFTHANLFYRYRNKLAHEFRSPGAGFESPTRPMEFPHYQRIGLMSPGLSGGLIISNKWELIYPIQFFAQLTENAIDSISQQYRESNKSPFVHYKEGSDWLR
ncbi:hypothetical protein [Enterobacter roggenkampii]|uniref:hypothetical protein n=1 Tax=Enterobacter roggenkampii TaxID=1812935 RepID=UPI0021C7D111|nr:hypothetical protein [Enterobacter roggenkampii]MCU2348205.1 hypothetical protein [Enterobacter roggenkampii]